MGCCNSKEDQDIPLTNLASEDVLEYTPPSKLKPYNVEDHFWDHKKKLIPDYKKMKDVDKRALEVNASVLQGWIHNFPKGGASGV